MVNKQIALGKLQILIGLVLFFCLFLSSAFAQIAISRPIIRLSDNTTFISQTVPAAMLPGIKYHVTVTFKNTGKTIWRPGSYALISQNPALNNTWSVRKVELFPREFIRSGQIKTFTFEITAPLKSGTYNFQWQMAKKEGSRLIYFGQKSPSLPIKVNSLPLINPINDQSTYEHKSLQFEVLAIDPDNDILTYSASNLPVGAIFNNSTRTFSWTPQHNQVGTYSNIHFEVSDGTAVAAKDITATVLKTIIFGTIYEKNEAGQDVGLVDVNIDVMDLTRTTIIASGITDATGHFDVFYETWADGTYIIRASKAGYKTYYGAATLRNNSMMPFSVTLVKESPLQITGIAPQDQSEFLSGAVINIQATATGSVPFEYQFSVGGAIKQAWLSSNTYAWQTTDSDVGTVGIKCEVRDTTGVYASSNISYRIINPTIQEVLQKVADNYSKIQDFTAEMTLSSTFNDNPFGQTDYCRYYFKAPDKEKTESFSDAGRTVKTEVMINDSSNMYLIDPINKVTQPVDLLSEAGITVSQFNQMDICYNQTNFLNSHNITKNIADTDFNNIIIALDAVPKTQNNLYSKLKLYIDYNKGIMSKSCLYKEDENGQMTLVQTMTVIEIQQMPNGAWSALKINKVPLLAFGNLIETAIYNNLQVNVGLTDLDFDPNRQ